ncbi:hypothetical protein [Schleiferilactobacillus shenzhenensis]|uniref:hypothetical protein n=1 Tax=Schleiferilactobacillus shenzhenensis TaxID=1231337 RepID=UPI0012DCA4AB|nr:hypothetical protein [Schleiferilactobacillus shenzhenensis]
MVTRNIELNISEIELLQEGLEALVDTYSLNDLPIDGAGRSYDYDDSGVTYTSFEADHANRISKLSNRLSTVLK